jgi:adenosylhomocysteine nucleosidase
MEYRGMLKRMKERFRGWQANRPAPPVFWVRTGTLNGHEAVLAANGAGTKRAAATVDALAGMFQPDAIVSTGFCGALDPELEIGELVIGTCVKAADRSYATRPFCGAGDHARGVVASLGHVVRTAAEKRQLRAQGASVVEMEAAGVAARAEMLGVPLFCARAVTDLASEDMANDFNAALRKDGQFATMRIFRHALSRPAVRFPELLRLRGNCIRAANTLGEFFADCEF